MYDTKHTIIHYKKRTINPQKMSNKKQNNQNKTDKHI
jgi:hypothetical protein